MHLVIHLDESGQMSNLKKDYFVIGGFYYVTNCENSDSKVTKYNKRTCLNVKKRHLDENGNLIEVKGKDLAVDEREYIFSRIHDHADMNVFGVVLNKPKIIKRSFFDDESRSYNFLIHILINNLLKEKEDIYNSVDKITLRIDERTIKVESRNTLKEYLNIDFQYRLEMNIEFCCEYRDSKNCNNTQIADFISNTLFATHYDYLKDCVSSKTQSIINESFITYFPY